MTDEDEEKIQISLAQVAASSLAAVSAAVVCSLFGVAGTIIGTAIASVCATVGSALYAHSLRRTKARLRQLHQAGAVSPPLAEVIKTTRQQWRRWFDEVPWRRASLGTAGVFLVAILVVTGIEVGVGKPLSALFGVSHSGSRSTTVCSVVGCGHRRHHHRSTPTGTPTPTANSTASSSSSSRPRPRPTATRTASPRPTTSASTSTTPSPTADPTPSPAATPSATATPG